MKNIINLSQEEKREIVEKIKSYFQQELEQEIGGFDAEFLLDFFISEIGHYFYNQALSDAHTLLEKQIDSMTDLFYTLEKSPPVKK